MAVSGFRLREGNEIGCRVTLRGQRMYEFLDRLISVALPRIRDFRGVNPKSFDGNGNYSLGLTEQLVFPEIDPDKVTFTQGMDVTFVTSTRQRRRGPRAAAAVRHAVPRSVIIRSDRDGTVRPIAMSTDSEEWSSSRKQLASKLEAQQEATRTRTKLRPREQIRIRLRCRLCGRPRAVYRKFGICRICFRDMASDGLIPGVKKASW